MMKKASILFVIFALSLVAVTQSQAPNTKKSIPLPKGKVTSADIKKIGLNQADTIIATLEKS